MGVKRNRISLLKPLRSGTVKLCTKIMKVEELKISEINDSKRHQKFWDNHRISSVVAIDTQGKLIASVQVGYNKYGNAYATFTGKTEQGVWFRGHGWAGGYGYCKRSAACADAIFNAGITVDTALHGCGMERIEQALEAIGKELSPNFLSVIRLY